MNPPQRIKLTVAVQSYHKEGHVHLPGTVGVVVEPLGLDAWIVEIPIPDPPQSPGEPGDHDYDTFDLRNDEIEFIENEG